VIQGSKYPFLLGNIEESTIVAVKLTQAKAAEVMQLDTCNPESKQRIVAPYNDGVHNGEAMGGNMGAKVFNATHDARRRVRDLDATCLENHTMPKVGCSCKDPNVVCISGNGFEDPPFR
jgi:hypothetical protein